MQEDDLKNLGQLFDKAGDGTSEEKWKERFEDFVKTSMGEHASRLKNSGGDAEKKAEAFRAKWGLFSIVEERLSARCEAAGDPEMALAIKALSQAQGQLFQEILSAMGTHFSLSPMSPNGAMDSSSYGDSPKLHLDVHDEDEELTGKSPIWATSPSSNERKIIQDSLNPDISENTMTPGTLEQAKSPKSPDPKAEVFREIKKCNSYALRHTKTKAFCSTGADDNVIFGNPLGKLSVGKELSLTQLMNIISSVYQAKADQDRQAVKDEVQPMEMHFYKFLAERYGIHAVREWADAIFKAVQKFSNKECRVAAFGKILQNRLNEDFPRTLETLCQKLQMSAREKMEERNGHRTQAEIETLWQAALQGRDRCGIQLSDCRDIVCHLYNDSDSADVMDRLQAECRKQASDQSNALPTDCIKLRDFCQVACFFQMHLTENFLSDFISIFCGVSEQIHAQGRGVLESAQLTELVRRLSHVQGLAHMQIAPLLEAREKATAQALKVKSATFSQCVDIFKDLISARYTSLEGVTSPQA